MIFSENINPRSSHTILQMKMYPHGSQFMADYILTVSRMIGGKKNAKHSYYKQVLHLLHCELGLQLPCFNISAQSSD